ncbi:hypothetical protein L195_g056177, partial [Trifolium pratense]
SEGKDTLGLQQSEIEDSARRSTMREGDDVRLLDGSVLREEEYGVAI